MSPKFFDRREAATRLTELGFKTSYNTLCKLATIGGGPVMRHFGRRVVYEESALIAWVESRLSGPKRSTSEAA